MSIKLPQTRRTMNQSAYGYQLDNGLLAVRRVFRSAVLLAVPLLLVVAGCGEDVDKPLLVVATGKAVHNGKPLTSGSIIFYPDRDAEYQKDNPTSMLQVDGTFTMKTFPFGEGIAPGKYKVCLSRPLAAGIKLPDYGDIKKTPWEIEIPDTGRTDIVFETK